MVDDTQVSKPKRRNTKEKIIDEAEALAALHGIEHLKLQDVADKIGIKLPSVYAHFSGREDILAAMGSRISKKMGQLYLSKPGESPLDTLKHGTIELLEFLGEHPAYFRLMLRDYSVPLGYDPLNHRALVNQPFALPQDVSELHSRIQSLIDRHNPVANLSAMDFAATVHGYLLVRLGWLSTRVDESGHVSVDYPSLKLIMNTMVTRLLSS